MVYAVAAQTVSLSSTVDTAGIESLYILGSNTLPARIAKMDWAYGNRGELFPVAYATAQSLRQYCLNRAGTIYNARLDDDACADSVWPYPQGYPNYFTEFEIGLQLLSSYGISGDLTVPSLNVFGGEILVSLVRNEGSSDLGPAVPYCTPVPSSGLDKITTGLDVASYIVQAQAQCTTSQRRRSLQQIGSEISIDTRGVKDVDDMKVGDLHLIRAYKNQIHDA